jgi:hypothetical protein
MRSSPRIVSLSSSMIFISGRAPGGGGTASAPGAPGPLKTGHDCHTNATNHDNCDREVGTRNSLPSPWSLPLRFGDGRYRVPHVLKLCLRAAPHVANGCMF